jgi:hypothetical protein
MNQHKGPSTRSVLPTIWYDLVRFAASVLQVNLLFGVFPKCVYRPCSNGCLIKNWIPN